MTYFYESRSFIWRHCEIFATIKEDNLDFDHILPQLQRNLKIAFSSLWPPRFKSLQITLPFFSFQSHGTQGFKKCSSFRIAFVLLQPSANSFLGCLCGFSKSWLTTVLVFQLSKSVVHGMQACVLIKVKVSLRSSPVLAYFFVVFWWKFPNCLFGLEVPTRGKTVKLIYHMVSKSLTTVSSLFI